MSATQTDVDVAMAALAQNESIVLFEALRALSHEAFIATISERLQVTRLQAELIARHRFEQLDQSTRELIYEALAEMQI